jgi:hypothetical protein
MLRSIDNPAARRSALRLIVRAASVALLSAALLSPAHVAPAVAGEGTWDIGEYDSCLRMPYDKIDKLMRDYVEHIRYCCWKSGGKWTGKKCVAPPADQPATTSSSPKLNIQ